MGRSFRLGKQRRRKRGTRVRTGRNSNGILQRDTGKVCIGKDNKGVRLGDGLWLYCKLGGMTRRRLQLFKN